MGSLRDGTVNRRYRSATLDANEKKAFGLDTPRETLDVAMGAQRYRVLMGGPAPTPPGAIYVEVEGQGVSVITAQLAAALGVTPDALRQRALVAWEANDLDALALDGLGGPRHLVKAPWQVWRGTALRFDGSTPEGRARVSAAALDRVWDALGRLKADAFLGADAGKAEPGVTVTLSPHGGRKVVVDVGGECPGHADDVIAVRREEGAAPLAACVPRGALDALSLPAAELRDEHLVGARADEVIDLQSKEGSTSLTIARSGSSWHEQSPTDRTIDPEVGRSFLERVLAVEATDLVPAPANLKALGLDPPRATVRVASALGEGREPRIELLDVGTPAAGVVHVRRVEDGMVATVDEAAAQALLPDETALRSKKALNLVASQNPGGAHLGPARDAAVRAARGRDLGPPGTAGRGALARRGAALGAPRDGGRALRGPLGRRGAPGARARQAAPVDPPRGRLGQGRAHRRRRARGPHGRRFLRARELGPHGVRRAAPARDRGRPVDD